VCHLSGVRFLCLLPLLLAFACGGCSLWKKKPPATAVVEDSRAIEARRMRALDYGDATSRRGAEIMVPDYTKQFDPTRSGVGTARTFGTGGARTKDFNFAQKVRTENFLTRAFSRSKSNAAADRKFATSEAKLLAKYGIPNADKDLGTKTAATKGLADGNKVAATRDLHDGKRPFLGQESKKIGTAIAPKELANWRTGGGEGVIYNNGTVDRVGNLKQLSVEDVRELLNKSK